MSTIRHRGSVPISRPRWIDAGAPNLREVAPRLFVGSEFAPMIVLPDGWHTIIDLYGRSKDITVNANRDHAYHKASVFLRMPFNDGAPVPPFVIAEAINAIAHGRRRGNVLVHCQAGLSRSASVVCAALCVEGLDDALARVKVPGFPQWPHPTTLAGAMAGIVGLRRSTH